MVVTQFYLVLLGSGGLRAALNERRAWFNDGGRDWRRKTTVPRWNWLNDERRNAIVRHPTVGAFATNWKSRAVVSGRLNGNSDVQEEIWLLVSDDGRWGMPTRTIGRGRATNRFIHNDSNTSSSFPGLSTCAAVARLQMKTRILFIYLFSNFILLFYIVEALQCMLCCLFQMLALMTHRNACIVASCLLHALLTLCNACIGIAMASANKGWDEVWKCEMKSVGEDIGEDLKCIM